MGQVTRYSESEQAWNKSEQNRITELQLARGFQVADIYLNRAYLDVFSAAPLREKIIPPFLVVLM